MFAVSSDLAHSMKRASVFPLRCRLSATTGHSRLGRRLLVFVLPHALHCWATATDRNPADRIAPANMIGIRKPMSATKEPKANDESSRTNVATSNGVERTLNRSALPWHSAHTTMYEFDSRRNVNPYPRRPPSANNRRSHFKERSSSDFEFNQESRRNSFK